MANQTLMRIDSFIKLQLCARCFPLLEPRRFKVEQDMALGGGLAKGQQKVRTHRGVTGMNVGTSLQPFWGLCRWLGTHLMCNKAERPGVWPGFCETGNLLMQAAEVLGSRKWRPQSPVSLRVPPQTPGAPGCG